MCSLCLHDSNYISKYNSNRCKDVNVNVNIVMRGHHINRDWESLADWFLTDFKCTVFKQ